MNKNYKFNSEQSEEPNQLSELKSKHQRNRRKNEVLNCFVLLIGVAGLFSAYTMPPDMLYPNSALEKSFSNNHSNEEKRTFEPSNISGNIEEVGVNNNFTIEGFLEANEPLNFKLESFKAESDVVYTIYFGDGRSKVIDEKSTFHYYDQQGNYEVKVTAKYQDEVEQIFAKRVTIEEGILVNAQAFTETN